MYYRCPTNDDHPRDLDPEHAQQYTFRTHVGTVPKGVVTVYAEGTTVSGGARIVCRRSDRGKSVSEKRQHQQLGLCQKY